MLQRAASSKILVLSWCLALGPIWPAGVAMADDPNTALDVRSAFYVGGINNDPVVSFRYFPHSWFRHYFPDENRGYFKTESGFAARTLELWKLVSGTGVWPRVRQEDAADTLSIVIDQAPKKPLPWSVTLTHPMATAKSGDEVVLRVTARADKPRTIGLIFSRKHPDSQRWKFLDCKLTDQPQTFELRSGKLKEDATFDPIINLGGEAGSISIEALELVGHQGVSLPERPLHEFVDYFCNAAGYRFPNLSQTCPDGVVRIAALGDSMTFGVGVQQADVFTAVLQRLLNEAPEGGAVPAPASTSGAAGTSAGSAAVPLAAGTAARFEVLNFGISGYSTDVERKVYETDAQKYQPRVVLVVMCTNDNLPTEEDRKLFTDLHAMTDIGPYRDAAGKLMAERGFGGCVAELTALDQEVRRHGARLVVVVFDHLGTPDWARMAQEVAVAMEPLQVPVVTIDQELRAAECFGDTSKVHEKYDAHPNHRAHAILAAKLATVLRAEGLLTAGPTKPDAPLPAAK